MATETSTQAGSSIPINQVLTAAKDVELKKLLRAKATAEARVKRAQEQVDVCDDAIEAYVARVYPAPAPVTP